MEDGLFAAIIAGLVAVMSAYLGAMWGRRHERERWARDQKLIVYSRFLDTLSDWDDQELKLRRATSLSHLSLSAPENITSLAEELDDILDQLRREVQNASEDKTALSQLENEYWRKSSCLKYMMRMDLHRVPRHRRRVYKKFINQVFNAYRRTRGPIEFYTVWPWTPFFRSWRRSDY